MASVAALHAQRDAQLRQRQRQPLVQVAHQRPCGTDIEDVQFGRAADGRAVAQDVPFQQRRDHRLGLAGRGGCDDQRVVSGQDERDRLLLNRRQVAVAGEKGGPGVGEVVSWSERFHDRFNCTPVSGNR